MNVLLVEDNNLESRFFQKLIVNIGLKLTVAVNTASKAKMYINNTHLDLAIVDVRLKRDSIGLDLIDELLSRSVLVLVVSGRHFDDYGYKKYLHKSVLFAKKPLNEVYLRALIYGLISKQNKLKIQEDVYLEKSNSFFKAKSENKEEFMRLETFDLGTDFISNEKNKVYFLKIKKALDSQVAQMLFCSNYIHVYFIPLSETQGITLVMSQIEKQQFNNYTEIL